MDALLKPGFHITQFIGDILSVTEGENEFINTGFIPGSHISLTSATSVVGTYS